MTKEPSRNYVKVEFEDNAEAKRLGARWDPERNSWYISNDRNEEAFYNALNVHRPPNTTGPAVPRRILDVPYVDPTHMKQRSLDLRSVGAQFDKGKKQWSVRADVDIRKIARWLKRTAPAPKQYAAHGDELSRYLRYCDDALQQSDLDKLVEGALRAAHEDIERGRLREVPTSKFLEKTQALADCLLTVAGNVGESSLHAYEDEADERLDRPSTIIEGPVDVTPDEDSLEYTDGQLRAVFVLFGKSWKRDENNLGWNTLVAVPAAMDEFGVLYPVNGQLPLVNVEFFEPQSKKREPLLGDAETLEEALADTEEFAGRTWAQYVAWFDELFARAIGPEHAPIERIRDFRHKHKPLDVRIAPYSHNDSMVVALRDLYVAAALVDRHRVPLLESLYVGRNEPRAPLFKGTLRKDALYHTGHMGSNFGLDPSQRLALRHLLATPEGQTLAVSGPPGTGKTSMMQSVIANLVVNAAVSEEQRAPIIIAASATNQAVTNIIKAFAAIGEPFGNYDLQARWIPDLRSYGWYFPSRSGAQKEEYLEFQQLVREREQNLWTFAGTATDFQSSRVANPNLSGLQLEYLLRYRTVFPYSKSHELQDAVNDLRKRLTHLIGSNGPGISIRRSLEAVEALVAVVELAPLRTRLKARGKIERHERRMNRIDRYEAALEQRLFAAKTAVRSFPEVGAEATSFRDVLAALLSPSRWSDLPSIFKRMFVAAGPDDDLTSQLLEEEQIAAQRRLDRFRQLRLRIEAKMPSRKLLAGIPEILSCLRLLEDIAMEFLAPASSQRWIEGLRAGLKSVDSDESSPDFSQGYKISKIVFGAAQNDELEDALEGFLDRTIRLRCFHLAARYWEGRWLLQADDVIDGSDQASVVAALRRHCMLAPVVVATAYTLPNLLRVPGIDDAPDEFAFSSADLLILDEAGQVAPPLAVALFSLAKRCITVGDVQQLAPIVGMSESQDNSLLRLHGFKDDIYRLRTAGLTTKKGSIMRAAQAASYFGGSGADITLLRHYRCQPTIIEFCNDLVYRHTQRLIPMTHELERPLYHPMSYVELDFESRKPAGGSRVNYAEAKEIVDWLVADRGRIESYYNTRKDGTVVRKDDPSYRDLRQLVALITPYAAQKDTLAQLVKHAFAFGAGDENDNEAERAQKMIIGTVHALQGAERRIVVFSPVSGSTDGGTPFMDSSWEMLNVAVSRAQDVFVLFGNRDLFFSQRARAKSNCAPSATLGRYMRARGKHLYPRSLVVLESPNKAPAVQATLGKGCKVLSTSGHFRDIAEIDFATMTVRWSLDPDKESKLGAICEALDDMDELVLATDDDQEGEAIAWHVLDTLNALRPMDGIIVTRMNFHEVTHEAISQGFAGRYGPWYGSRRADAALARAIIDKVLGESLTETLTTAMSERGHRGRRGMGRVKAALLELLERDADEAKNEYVVRADLRADDATLCGYLVEHPTDFEPLRLTSVDAARHVLAEMQMPSLSEATQCDVTRFSLGPPEPSSTAELLIRAYEELDGMMPEKTQTLLQHLYEGSS